MIDLGNMVYFRGVDIQHSNKGIIVHQLKYELKLLNRFELMNHKSLVTPVETKHKLDYDVNGEDVDATNFKQLIGSPRYMCYTRSNICYAIGMVSRFISKAK